MQTIFNISYLCFNSLHSGNDDSENSEPQKTKEEEAKEDERAKEEKPEASRSPSPEETVEAPQHQTSVLSDHDTDAASSKIYARPFNLVSINETSDSTLWHLWWWFQWEVSQSSST